MWSLWTMDMEEGGDLQHKPYLVKWSTQRGKGRGAKNVQKLSTWFMDGRLSKKNDKFKTKQA